MRRTKHDAEQTRNAILDAAERLFAERGLSASSLEAISRAAGVTRGAFYWHFKDKLDLLTAMRQRRILPQEEILMIAAEQGHEDPLGLLEAGGRDMLALFEADPGQQQFFRLLSSHLENDEAAEWLSTTNREMFGLIHRMTDLAREKGVLNPAFAPDEAAVLVMVTMNGLINEWLRSGKAFALTALGSKIIAAQMALLRDAGTGPPASRDRRTGPARDGPECPLTPASLPPIPAQKDHR